MDIINNLLSIKIKKRIHLIQKAIENPIEYQDQILKSHISCAKNTLFGKQYDFHSIKSYTEFKNKVPINNYEDLKQYIEQTKKNGNNILWPGKVKWFSKSSGTTNNKTKFIPITKHSLHNNHFEAGKDMLAIYLNNFSSSKLLNGKSLMIGGSTSIDKFNSYYAGDLSAIIIKNLPFWVQLKRSPSLKTALLSNWEKKIDYIVNETIKSNITSISGVPSWTLIVINKLLNKTGASCISDIWPNIELYMHGGVNFDNYQDSFNTLIYKKSINYLNLYNASEGFFGIQYYANQNDLLLLVHRGIFYEFIPIESGEEQNDQIVSLKNVKKNQIYSMVISTNGGLWRYKIGDTIKFTSLQPYKIEIVGRIQSFINAFGEELNVYHANQAINYAAKKTNATVSEYIAAPFFYQDKSGCHEWIVEFEKMPNCIIKFQQFLDQKLKLLNSDYELKRDGDILIKKPIIHPVRKNFFYSIMKKEKKIGGQNKIKRLHNNRNFIENLVKNI